LKKIYIAIAYLYIWFVPSFAQQEAFYNIYNYTPRDLGLDMLLFEIVQDSRGILWFRDYSSIGTYDGHKYQNKTFDLEKIAGENQDIFDIHSDSDGIIWVACSAGLFYHDDVSGFVKAEIDGIANLTFSSITDTPNNTFFAATSEGKIYRFNTETKTINQSFIIDHGHHIVKYMLYHEGSLWVSTRDGIFMCDEHGCCQKVYTFDPYDHAYTFADNRYLKIKPLKDGTILANDNNGQIIFLNREGSVKKILDFHLKSTEKAVNDWIEISDHHILFATYDGIYNYNPTTGTLVHKGNKYFSNNQLYNTQLLCSYKTKNNTIFFGSALCLSKINILNEDFANFNYVFPSKTVLVKEIPSLSHQWLIVTEQDGILIFDPVKSESRNYLNLKGETVDYALYDEDENVLWLATRQSILKVNTNIKPGIIRQYRKSYAKTTGMSVYHKDVWFVSGGVLHQLDSQKNTVKVINHPNIILEGISHNSDGDLFVGMEKLYLVKSDSLISMTNERLPLLHGIHCITHDQNGSIYFGSDRTFIVYHHKRKKWDIFNLKNGLPNEPLGYMVHDGDHHVWMCTRASGICRFDLRTHTSRYFKEDDGLVDNIYLFGISNIKKGIVAAHRWQFFSYYQPKKSKELISLTKIIFDNIMINEKHVDLTQLREGKLSFSSGNSLVKMDVLFPSYINKSMYQLQYRLKSENDSLWTDIEDHQRLILNQISPGAYKLECRAFNKLIPEDQVYASLDVVSLSPFYQKWWFIMFCLLTSYLILYLIYRYRKLQNAKIAKLRSSISQDLHDEMGSNLSNIMLLGELALLQNTNNRSTMKLMVDKTRSVIQSMSDIVWSIHPGNDILPNIIQRIQDNCVEILEPLGITVKFEIQDDVKNETLNMYQRQAFYMILKEAINNCGKYSHAKNAMLQINLSNNKLISIFSDDGKGFEYSTNKKGNGIYNIKSRALSIGGKATVDSAPNQGTKVILVIPIKSNRPWIR
jgi:ligand-binding sensor domain-containing protein/two-component sensor histidine kinase